MRKITLLIASLFIAIGAMAQTFVEPVTGKYYKIKGDSQSFPWVTANANSSGSVVVSANEADAALFEKTANGFKAVSTGKYLGYVDGKFGYSDNEITVELVNTGSQANSEGKYAIKSGNNWMYNNQTDGIVHESSTWLTDIERFWGFIEVTEMTVVLISRTDWTVTASSQETSGDPGQATNAIDGDNSTFWHTVYAETYPHWIEFDMQKTHRIDYFDYVSRFDDTNTNGNILNYKLYVSDSSMNGNYDNATLAASGTFEYGKGVNHLIELASPATGRYVALVAESGTRGNWEGNAAANAANCAEFYIYRAVVPNEGAKADLLEAIKQAEDWLAERTIGSGVGEYSGGEFANNAYFESFLEGMNGYYNTIYTGTPIDEIKEYTQLISETKASYNLNMPVAGKYYRLKNNQSGWYATSDLRKDESEHANKLYMKEDGNQANTIWYLAANNAFLSYTVGQYLGDMSSDWSFETIGSEGNSAVFAQGATIGKYQIKPSSGRALYGDQVRVDAAGEGNNSGYYEWIIEEVTTLPVTISSVGYATFYAPVAVEIPENVKAYYLESEEKVTPGYISLTKIEGNVIPANTGVILEVTKEGTKEGTYNFNITEYNGAINSLLTGTVAATYVEGEAYVLSALNDELGFYKAKLNRDENGVLDEENGTHFKNNSHKAYLQRPINGQSVASYTLSFDFDGTTAVEDVEVENEEGVKVIYDLTGRKLDDITAPGIYIINGKKHIIR